jgi:hypothetical protein
VAAVAHSHGPCLADQPFDSTMSSLHSCHWDWCRFTTVLHEDFVQHVISAHIDKAGPIKRGDISLIRQVEQGTSSHSTSGEPPLAVSSLFHIRRHFHRWILEQRCHKCPIRSAPICFTTCSIHWEPPTGPAAFPFPSLSARFQGRSPASPRTSKCPNDEPCVVVCLRFDLHPPGFSAKPTDNRL